MSFSCPELALTGTRNTNQTEKGTNCEPTRSTKYKNLKEKEERNTVVLLWSMKRQSTIKDLMIRVSSGRQKLMAKTRIRRNRVADRVRWVIKPTTKSTRNYKVNGFVQYRKL